MTRPVEFTSRPNERDAERRAALKELQRIPGIGKSMSIDLWNLGYRSVHEIKGEDPQAMYDVHCRLAGTVVDRCVLYTYRCAVYYASNETHDTELLKWWNWKDGS